MPDVLVENYRNVQEDWYARVIYARRNTNHFVTLPSALVIYSIGL